MAQHRAHRRLLRRRALSVPPQRGWWAAFCKRHGRRQRWDAYICETTWKRIATDRRYIEQGERMFVAPVPATITRVLNGQTVTLPDLDDWRTDTMETAIVGVK